MSNFTPFMAKQLIEADEEPTRFEKFCLDLYTDVDGIEYVPTSRSWDLGRDARSRGRPGRSEFAVLACSLRSDYSSKLLEDIERIVETSAPTAIRVCFSKPLSEHELDKAVAEIRKTFPDVEDVFCDGSYQLAQCALKQPKAFSDHYGGDLANLHDTLFAKGELTGQVALRGLRTALATQLTEDSLELRDDIVRDVLLTILGDASDGLHLTALPKKVTDYLQLHRLVAQPYVQYAVEKLVDDGLASNDASTISLTSLGREDLATRLDKRAASLITGRSIFATEVSRLTGRQLRVNDLTHVWKTFQSEMAQVFMEHGIDIVDAIMSIGDGSASTTKHQSFGELLGRLAETMNGLGYNARYSFDLGQATRDIFASPESPGYKWLSEVCLVFVGICSLGLEPTAQEQLTAQIAEIDILVDTDILLSYLSPGEMQHEAVKHTLDTWRSNVGKLYITSPVLEEVAYHAWISENDFRRVEHDIHKYDDVEAENEITNVFVRGFRRVCEGDFSRRHWRRYIQTFRGEKPYDATSVQRLVIGEGRWEWLDETDIDNDLAARVARQLVANRLEELDTRQYVGESFEDKCSRDGRLVAILKQRRTVLARQGGGAAVIASSSKLLREAVSVLAKNDREIDAVLPVASLTFLLAFHPGVKLGLTNLKRLLFDEHMHQRMRPFDRLAIAALKASKEYKLFWSNRTLLLHEVRRGVVKLSKQRGEATKKTYSMLVEDSDDAKHEMAHIVAEAIDKIAKSESEKEIEELAAENERLKVEITRLKQRKKR